MSRRLLRGGAVLVGLLLVWQGIVTLGGLPSYILPGPAAVAVALVARAGLIAGHALRTLIEILLGLGLGAALGCTTALVMSYFRPARHWLLPVVVVSQAIPVFALAPLLVLWFGYGIASKVAMAVLIIYFPITAAFFDGLRRTEPGWLDLAHSMDARRWRVLVHIRLPAALPALATGLRVATAVAPIGAVIGEWVGASAGLGYLMLHANARVQIDLMFAALVTLAAIGVGLYFAVDALLRRLVPWQPETLFAED